VKWYRAYSEKKAENHPIGGRIIHQERERDTHKGEKGEAIGKKLFVIKKGNE